MSGRELTSSVICSFLGYSASNTVAMGHMSFLGVTIPIFDCGRLKLQSN